VALRFHEQLHTVFIHKKPIFTDSFPGLETFRSLAYWKLQATKLIRRSEDDITVGVEFVLCYLQVILHSTYETIEQTQLDKQRALIHLLQLHTHTTHNQSINYINHHGTMWSYTKITFLYPSSQVFHTLKCCISVTMLMSERSTVQDNTLQQ